MNARKIICIILVISSLVCLMSSATMAANGVGSGNAGIYATGSIRFDVQANSLAISRTTMPLEVGETVVINAAYTPSSANIRIGIVDSDDQFYYVTISGGNVDVEITISERGNYRLAVYNLSSSLISMSGYVNY